MNTETVAERRRQVRETREKYIFKLFVNILADHFWKIMFREPIKTNIKSGKKTIKYS